MTFKDHLDTDLDIFFSDDEFAVKSQYLAHGEAEAVTVRSIWEFAPVMGSGKGMDIDSAYKAGMADYAEVMIPESDLDSAPAYRDQITHPDDDDPWLVQQPRREPGMWIVPVNRDQRGSYRG